jgi:hypothetical protein
MKRVSLPDTISSGFSDSGFRTEYHRTYCLANDKSPVGPFQGEDSVPFSPDNVEAKHINDACKVVDRSHWILDFGAVKTQAETAVQIIKKYGFKYICFVDRPNAPFMYFRQ